VLRLLRLFWQPWLPLISAIPLLVSCSALPVLPFLSLGQGDTAAKVSAPDPVLRGARGPLTTAQSKAVLDRLAATGQKTDIFERHLAIEEEVAGSPLTTGNHVLLLQDGPATYSAMLRAIANARDHIHLQTYILDDDEVGRQFVQALISRQRQGVQVNLIRDSVGTLNTPAALFERLQASGVAVLEFNPISPLVARKEWTINRRDHRKLLIVDGHTAFLGGINISSVYSGGSSRKHTAASPAWRDTHLQLQGPVVAELQKLFLASWALQLGPPLLQRQWYPPPQVVGKLVVRAIGSSPDEPFSPIYVTLLSAINSAETSVQITNAYFAPDPQLLATLMAASARGVTVTMILPSQTDSWLVFHTGRGYYEGLLRAGVRIFERQDAILHSKTALVDGVWATVGSTNLDWRSFLHNHELNAVVLGSDFGKQMQAMIDKDLAASKAITLQAWQQRGPLLRLKEWFSRWWEYWL